ncbi:HWE histidine kinase domain-containing protein [uncultured Methylobacterium sp.]|uniref:HWE histidine kinase domain-containing protein n=1 Tax=uncultured Methylobacterium sp. TaxID=157278 RepID=UPI0035CB274F
MPLLDAYVRRTGEFAALWPTSRQLSPKIRAFVDFLAGHLKIGDWTSIDPGQATKHSSASRTNETAHEPCGLVTLEVYLIRNFGGQKRIFGSAITRAQGDDQGIVGSVMFGIFLDSTGRKQAEYGHELLAGEISHRVKNLLAIATALTAFTSRSTTTMEDMARELTQRLTTLGRAHDLARPFPGGEGKAALLGDLLAILLAPYDDMGPSAGASASPFRGWASARRRPPPSRSSCMSWRRIPSRTARSRCRRGRSTCRLPRPRTRSC